MIRPVFYVVGQVCVYGLGRESHPKQFIEITPNQNLLDLTLRE